MKKNASRRKSKNTSGKMARRIKTIVDILVPLIGLATASIQLYEAATTKAPVISQALDALRALQFA